ncbi:MAG: C40 family peptidase [Sphingobacteriales bacterium]|nr:C40 family peptidase [Sphingobacteriales bacterium]
MRYFFFLFGMAAMVSSCSSLKSTTRSGKSASPGVALSNANAVGSGSQRKNEALPAIPDVKNAPKIIFFRPFNIEKGDPLQFKYAIKMNVEVERLVNADLYRFIDNWWGTPYRMGGATQQGVDCSAFTQTLMSVIYGQDIPRTAQGQKDFCSLVDLNDLHEGDLIFFKTRKGREITHVGIYLQDDQFVHASSSNGVMISSLKEPYWSRNFVSAGRVVDEKIAAVSSGK